MTSINFIGSFATQLGKCLSLLALALSVGLMVVPGAQAQSETSAQKTSVQETSVVNINVADAKTLAAALKGIGLSRAEDIIRYREQFGPFTTVEQLSEVKGIGVATIETNRTRIKLD